jgi:hypothetical protein
MKKNKRLDRTVLNDLIVENDILALKPLVNLKFCVLFRINFILPYSCLI